MDLRLKLQEIEETTMAHLKDFQCATVERIDELFRCGQNRILVADEVGLGKTLIARGAISKTALIQCEMNKELFKIVYICSNQVIADQNIRKLDVFNVRPDRNAEDARLSMQHLRIAEQEFSTKNNGTFAQLIPLTPSTSFSMTNGFGTKQERALMFAIVKRMPQCASCLEEMDSFISRGVYSWEWYVNEYEKKIDRLEKTGLGYPQNVINKINEIDKERGILSDLLNHIYELQYEEYVTESDKSVLQKLRKMFAEISVDMLQPDLVIMDEFQRFKYLIDSDEQYSETGVLARKFFETPDLKVLLLSATPYKLYSTIEEIEEADNPDEFYKEFLQVIGFLLNDEEKMDAFSDVWSNYSVALKEAIKGDSAVLCLKKMAEDKMYDLMCRTERISVMDSGDFIDDSSVQDPLKISGGDIHTYVDMGKLLQSIDNGRSLLVDYAKSSPYLMSFMNHYKVKEQIEEYLKKNPDEIYRAKGNYLWINRKHMEHYDEVPDNNARLEELKKRVFYNQSELYMWIPPSMPYYPLEGVYKNSKNYSKVLVFSSWEMVPKMIGSLISYEEERRTVGVLSKDEKLKSKNNTYFSESKLRYPPARLRFNVSGGEARGMYMFCLLYPSETLSEIYHPLEYLNAGFSLSEIREDIGLKLDSLLAPIIKEYEKDSLRDDKRWYYLAPALLDGKDYVSTWLNAMMFYGDNEGLEDLGSSGLYTHITKFKELINGVLNGTVSLGRVPKDLTAVLADIAIGSFAVCAYRSNGGDVRRASELSKAFVNRFNSTEATATVMLAYKEDEDAEGEGHWRNVLRYCCDGGFGAMLDEYIHMVSEGAGFGMSEDRNEQIHNTMVDALKIRAASYMVDTYPAFNKKLRGEKNQRTFMRSHFAVAFANGEGTEVKDADRKNSIRNSFNSPLRPFVLATTSIGQEGLDFHQYCRRIMHWNLPSNPIDVGRILRTFKIKKNVEVTDNGKIII